MTQLTLPSSLKTYSVLPDNRSALERSLELALSNQIYSISNPYPDLLNAETTSTDIVPYIAADREVPIWDTLDTEQVKRNLANNAWQTRKLSGTRAGLKMALESFSFMSTITPWHAQVPQGEPYSLDIVAWESGNNPVNADNAIKLISYLEETKSERDNIELSLMFGVETNLGLAGAINPGASISETSGNAQLWPMPEANIYLSIAAAVPPAVNIAPINSLAAIPVITGYAELGATISATHNSVTLSGLSATAVLKV